MLSSRDRTSRLFADYLHNYEQISSDDLQLSIQPVASLKAAALGCRKLLGSVEGRSVCEVGVGQGWLIRELLADTPATLVAVDIAYRYLRQLKGDDVIPVIANAENLPFEDEFDIVVATDILEHVLRPGDFLLSARRALRVGGTLLVRVPCRESLVAYATLAGAEYDLVHLRTYDKGLLTRELEDSGFAVERFSHDIQERVRLRRWIRLPRRVRVALGYETDRPWLESGPEPVTSGRPGAPDTVTDDVASPLRRSLRAVARLAARAMHSETPLGRFLNEPVSVTAIAHRIR